MKLFRRRDELQSGQAMVLVALAFVGLAAFIGLATDAGILFSTVGSLRRAVDAAALSASNQFREGQSQSDIEASARQFIKINLPNYDPSLDLPGTPCDPELTDCVAVRVQTCENDVTLCPPGSPLDPSAAAAGRSIPVSMRTGARFFGSIAARDRRWSRMARHSASRTSIP